MINLRSRLKASNHFNFRQNDIKKKKKEEKKLPIQIPFHQQPKTGKEKHYRARENSTKTKLQQSKIPGTVAESRAEYYKGKKKGLQRRRRRREMGGRN